MITDVQIQDLANEIGISFDEVPMREFRRGVEYEAQHTGNLQEAAQRAATQLRTEPTYYHRLLLISSASFKPQWMRLAEVLLIGPLMVSGGVSLARRRPLFGVLLGALGLGTIYYNARNWWWIRQTKGDR